MDGVLILLSVLCDLLFHFLHTLEFKPTLNVSYAEKNLAKLLVHDPSAARQALSKFPMSDSARAQA